jgi:hypothetical protein
MSRGIMYGIISREQVFSKHTAKQLISKCCDTPIVTVINNPLTPNDHYNGRTASLTSKRYILYIYSTNIGTESYVYWTVHHLDS